MKGIEVKEKVGLLFAGERYRRINGSKILGFVGYHLTEDPIPMAGGKTHERKNKIRNSVTINSP